MLNFGERVDDQKDSSKKPILHWRSGYSRRSVVGTTHLCHLPRPHIKQETYLRFSQFRIFLWNEILKIPRAVLSRGGNAPLQRIAPEVSGRRHIPPSLVSSLLPVYPRHSTDSVFSLQERRVVILVAQERKNRKKKKKPMCRSEIRKAFGIHAACQDRNCSVSTIRKLLDKAGPEVLGEKDVYGRVVSNVLFSCLWKFLFSVFPHMLSLFSVLHSAIVLCDTKKVFFARDTDALGRLPRRHSRGRFLWRPAPVHVVWCTN